MLNIGKQQMTTIRNTKFAIRNCTAVLEKSNVGENLFIGVIIQHL